MGAADRQEEPFPPGSRKGKDEKGKLFGGKTRFRKERGGTATGIGGRKKRGDSHFADKEGKVRARTETFEANVLSVHLLGDQHN